jgi:dephospho-CoA kinase
MSAAGSPRILRAGLTGGIASGKTTVAGFLEERGAFRIDADRIAHALMEPGGAAFGPVVERFGPEILDSEGRIRRAALAATVFRDPAALEALNALVHPRVTEEIDRRILFYAEVGRAPVVVVDAALLVESGFYRGLHKLVVVRCSRESQLRRLLARGGLSPEEALARIESQAPLETKLAVADYVIDTDTTLDETRRAAERVYAALLADFERIFGVPRHGLPGA